MSLNLNSTANDLFEKIRSRFDKIRLGDEKANNTQDPELARFFNFDFVSKDGTNFGNIHASLIDEKSLKVYFSKSITDNLNDMQKSEWFDFLRSLRMFAKRHMLSFDTRDITRSNLELKDVKQVARTETPYSKDDVNESIEEGWKSKAAAAALSGALAAGAPQADAVVVNPLRTIDARGNTAADPYKNKAPVTQKVVTVGGREFSKKELPTDKSKVTLSKTDDGRSVYTWVEKSGMRPQYTYYWWAPVNESSDYFRRRQREEDIISGKKPARKRKPNQTSDYQKKREKEKVNELSTGTYDKAKTAASKALIPALMGTDGKPASKSRAAKHGRAMSMADRLKNKVTVESKIYGINRQQSAQDVARKNARIVIKHSKPVVDEVRGARSRAIESIFIENTAGERFKVPSNSLAEARALARHVAEGGNVYDDFGKHITEICQECATLREFMRGTRGKQFVDEAADEIVNTAAKHYLHLHNLVHSLKGAKGYRAYKSTWDQREPEDELFDEVDPEELRRKFRQERIDPRIDKTVETAYKAYQKYNQVQLHELGEFKDHLDQIEEGTWSTPSQDFQFDELAELFSEPLILGVDAINATGALYDLIGDDQLFDMLGQMASDDPEQDCRQAVLYWLGNHMPEIHAKLVHAIKSSSTESNSEQE